MLPCYLYLEVLFFLRIRDIKEFFMKTYLELVTWFSIMIAEFTDNFLKPKRSKYLAIRLRFILLKLLMTCSNENNSNNNTHRYPAHLTTSSLDLI
jgi:hypothetical protein